MKGCFYDIIFDHQFVISSLFNTPLNATLTLFILACHKDVTFKERPRFKEELGCKISLHSNFIFL